MRILVTGAGGLLGRYLLRDLAQTSHTVAAWSGTQSGNAFGMPLAPVPLMDGECVERALALARPDSIIHTAAMAGVASCFRSPDAAWRINVDATRQLAAGASQRSARFIFISTDLVFDGRRGGYSENDVACPLSCYGRTKVAAEQAVLAYGRGLVVRASLLFGPALGPRQSFFDQQIEALRSGSSCPLFIDEWRTPLALSTAASAIATLAESDFTGLLHLGGPERMSRFEMGMRLARAFDLDGGNLVAVGRDSAHADEERPRDVSLDSGRWRQLFPDHPWPGFEQALREMMA
ncbi:MAG: SDR family oxidoreductase [Pirellulales bacterium]